MRQPERGFWPRVPRLTIPFPKPCWPRVRERGGRSAFLTFVAALGGRPSRDAILAAIATTIAWGPLIRKRVSRSTAETFPWYLRLYGVMLGASIPGEHHRHNRLRGVSREERLGRFTLADVASLALTGKTPTAAETRLLQILIGLLISNGPGSISAQAPRARSRPTAPRPRGECRSIRPWSAS
jgi:hypothetical protein